MKWTLFLNCILLYFNMICEEVIRPKEKEDCFRRTFVGEFNKTNAYCCFLNIEKEGESINKCSIHFKDEIDKDSVYDTIKFLKYVNTHYEDEEVKIKSLDCNCNYLNTNYFIGILFFIIIEILFN